MNLETRKAGKESIDKRNGGHPNSTVPTKTPSDSWFVSCFPAFQIQEISSIFG